MMSAWCLEWPRLSAAIMCYSEAEKRSSRMAKYAYHRACMVSLLTRCNHPWVWTLQAASMSILSRNRTPMNLISLLDCHLALCC